jgi:hypothetical protein
MSMISFLPDWIFYAITLAGVAGTVLTIAFGWIIPIQYRLGLQILSAFLLAIGSFFIGGISNEADWQLKIKETEAKVAVQEKKAAEISTEVVIKYVDRIKIVEGKSREIIKEIPIYINEKSDAECRINNGAIILLNSGASQSAVPITTRDTNEEASDVKLSEVVTNIQQNYGTYYQVASQLESLQEWILNQKELSDGN